MSYDILPISVYKVNPKTAICTTSSDFETIEINDILENIKSLLQYIIAEKRKKMKFKFTKIDYQESAINAVVDIFESAKNIAISNNDFVMQNAPTYDQIVANQLEIDTDIISKNLKLIQSQNSIESELFTGNMDFSVEMETGTGKTYVYLSTILRLHQKYGLRKFIILVPSVAIREGVLKTLQQTREHFRDLYNIGFGYFSYDSDKLSQVRDFIQSNDVQIMIMTIQSFNNDTTIMRQSDRDDTYGQKSYLDMVAQTRPVVIMDEPQNMESELAQSAIADLNPLFKLRYSATHKEIHNLVYRLTPVDAYRKNLVKKISVYGVKESNANATVLTVLSLEARKGKDPVAKIRIEVKKADGTYEEKEVSVTTGDDLYQKSRRNEKYLDMVVTDVNVRMNRLEIGSEYFSPDTGSENKEVIFRTQIQQTIKAHFDKQTEIGDRLKVLSLFFIDRVNNYVPEESLIKNIFIQEFTKLQKNYPLFKDLDPQKVHKGYFASKKIKGVLEYKDSSSGSSKEDKDAYDLIMKDKERLLSFTEPVSFIFSHSALKEGWDNPNIFQICTLRETHSITKKRQEIGRGLRLPVDVFGNRISDPDVNILTVVANASYEEYAKSLQQEFIEAGYIGDVETRNARENRVAIITTKHIDSEEFKELWSRISKRTVFKLEVITDQLIKNAVDKINNLTTRGLYITVEKGQIYFGKDNTASNVRESSAVGYRIDTDISIPNIIDRIAREIGITRKTVYEILQKSETCDQVFTNPEEFIRNITLIIKTELNNLLVNEGLKYEPTGDSWEISILYEDLKPILESKSLAVSRSVTDHIEFDGKGERAFAERLDNSSKVVVYTKLPRKFVVHTPLGDYVPDWAIVWKTDNGEKLYLVRETKFKYNDLEKELTWDEQQKIKSAQKHFDSIGVDYKVAESEELLDLIER